MKEFKYLCPQCRNTLVFQENKFICQKCSAEWKVMEGVARLSRSPSYWSHLTAEEMKRFLSMVKTKGWRSAVFSPDNPKIKNLYFMMDCPSRADGTFFLSLTPESVVLDLGSGWGSYTFALSPRVKSVTAADANFNSLVFISLRAQQEGRENIVPVQIEPLDFGELPFADETFSAVIMNGVLEWVGSYVDKGDPLKLQKNCLKEVRRVLKEAGEVWIGIENRFGLRYLLGSPDDHLLYYSSKGIPYTTILPRFISDWITRKALGRPYRTYTHSWWGYRRLLRGAGFRSIEFYYPEQHYRAPSSKIYLAKSQEVRGNMREKMRKLKRLKFLSFFGLERALCDSYFILAKK